MPTNAQEAAGAPSTNGATPALPEHLAELMARMRRDRAARANPVQLLEENRALKATIEELRGVLQEVRDKAESLAAPEHYPGVITAVDEWGDRLRVEVHVPGMSPVRADVHPDVDVDKVRVGALGHLSRARNCLMDISDVAPTWKDVGVFEEYLEGGERILARYMEQSIALSLSYELCDERLQHGDRIGFDIAMAMAYSRLPAGDTGHLFAEDVPVDDFAELGGLEPQIELLKQAIGFRLLHQEIARRYGLPRKQGILLEGPPGNGKTRLARCAANYVTQLNGGAACRFMCVTGSELYSMWLGGTEQNLKQRFAAAQEAARSGPVVMFFDEIDALGRRRGTDHGSSAPDRILATLLGFMDDVERKLENVVIIAATNRADQLDPGLTRPGRLDLKVTVPPPNRRGAECILRRYLGGGKPLASTVDELVLPLVSAIYSPRSAYAELATVKLSDGRQLPVAGRELMSGAVLEHVVSEAAKAAGWREAQSGDARGISAEDLAAALDRELATTAGMLSPANVKAYVRSVPNDSHPVDVRMAAGRLGLRLRSA